MRRVFESVLVILAVAAALLPFPRPAVERIYSRGVYPLIQPRLTAFSNYLNLALFDVALVGWYKLAAVQIACGRRDFGDTPIAWEWWLDAWERDQRGDSLPEPPASCESLFSKPE